MPLPLIKTWRVLIYNRAGVAIPANTITVTLTPFTINASGVLTPGSNILVIAPSDGSPASGGIADCAFATSSTLWVDNSTTGYLGGAMLVSVDLSTVTPALGGYINVWVQNSVNAGTTWPPNSRGLLLYHPLSGVNTLGFVQSAVNSDTFVI
jgi:hypothetical protein